MTTQERPKAEESGVRRVVANLARFPLRSWRSTARAVNPDYLMQWRANWSVAAWLPRPRRAELDAIPGLSSLREGTLLCDLARRAPSGGLVVEIGAFKGKSTAWLMEGAEARPDKLPMVSIDPHGKTWDAFNETCRRFKLLERGLEVHRNFSHDIGATWARPISLLWIDGGHEYEDVEHDINDFVPHLLAGGYVIFDDAARGRFPGVERAIAQLMSRRPDFAHGVTIKNFQIFRKNPVEAKL